MKTFARRVLSVILCVIAGAGAYFLVSSDLQHLTIERREQSHELVPNKPPLRAIVSGDVQMKQHGHSIGTVLKGTVVFLSEPPKTPGHEVVLLGWVWSKSTVEQAGIVSFLVPENVRYRANSLIIAHLHPPALGEHVFTNGARSWHLISITGSLPASALTLIDSEQHQSLWEKLKAPRSILSVTTRNGGLPVTYNLLEPTIQIVLLMFVVIVGVARLTMAEAETRKALFTEIIKATLQVLVGVLLAFLIFGLGLKS